MALDKDVYRGFKMKDLKTKWKADLHETNTYMMNRVLDETGYGRALVQDPKDCVLIAAVPELLRACVMVYEGFMLPQKHTTQEIKEALEEALVKAQCFGVISK